jgi:hypothetical protein
MLRGVWLCLRHTKTLLIWWLPGATIATCFEAANGWTYRLPGHAVAQLVEAVRYKPEGRGFDF